VKVFLGERLIEAAQARIPPEDRGFLLGDGVFETFGVKAGQARDVPAHLERLRAGLSALGFHPALSDADLEAALAETIAANGVETGSARLTLSRGPGPRGLVPPEPSTPTLLITAQPRTGAPPGPAKAAIATVTRRNEHSPLARLKTLNYLDSVLALNEARAKGADEALLLNTAGRLACASAANLYLVISGQAVTPPVVEGVLPGTVRRHLLDGGEATERALFPADAAQASEAFLTSSAGVRAVVAVDGRPVGDGRPGPVFERIAAAFG
jgi:branched-chain amino acid aminotransferase